MKSLLTYLAVVIATSGLVILAVTPLKTGEPSSSLHVALAFALAALLMGLAQITKRR